MNIDRTHVGLTVLTLLVSFSFIISIVSLMNFGKDFESEDLNVLIDAIDINNVTNVTTIENLSCDTITSLIFTTDPLKKMKLVEQISNISKFFVEDNTLQVGNGEISSLSVNDFTICGEGGKKVVIKASSDVGSDIQTIILPIDEGAADSFLKFDGSGQTSWGEISSIGGSSDIIGSSVDVGSGPITTTGSIACSTLSTNTINCSSITSSGLFTSNGSIISTSLDAGSGTIQTNGTIQGGVINGTTFDGVSFSTNTLTASGAITAGSVDAGSGDIKTNGAVIGGSISTGAITGPSSITGNIVSTGSITGTSLDASDGTIETTAGVNCGSLNVNNQLIVGDDGIIIAGKLSKTLSLTSSSTVNITDEHIIYLINVSTGNITINLPEIEVSGHVIELVKDTTEITQILSPSGDSIVGVKDAITNFNATTGERLTLIARFVQGSSTWYAY
jgi:hypothetical protein